MATVAERPRVPELGTDILSGTSRANFIDRWIFVGMAAWFILIVLAGFIPDSLMKLGLVAAGARPPFPLILHVHAVLMGSFMLLLLAQGAMVATGRSALHKQVGIAAFLLVPALVVVGLVLAPIMFHQVWSGAHFGPPPLRVVLAPAIPVIENILLLQIRAGLLFAVIIGIALSVRLERPGLHKRLIFLGTAVPLGAAIDRIEWLPSSMPAHAWATDIYTLLAISPMFVWDVMRNARVHHAYKLWLAIYLPAALLLNYTWDKPWWHAMAERLMGV